VTWNDDRCIFKVLCDDTHFHVLTAKLGDSPEGSCRVCSLDLETSGEWSAWLSLESLDCLALLQDADNAMVVFKNVLFYVREGTVVSLHLRTAAHDVCLVPTTTLVEGSCGFAFRGRGSSVARAQVSLISPSLKSLPVSGSLISPSL